MKRGLLLLVVLLGPLPRAAAGQDSPPVVAVLSSQSGPYAEALAGFRQEWGSEVPVLILGSSDRPNIPHGVQTVVAFGGKAVTAKYPSSLDLIYCMSPATRAPDDGQRAVTVGVLLTPRPEILAARIKGLQPALKRIGVLWSLDLYEVEVEEMRKAFAAIGVELVAKQVRSPDGLPGALRDIFGRVDALWIPPDPSLINKQNMVSLREFSWGNGIPFYAPMAGIVEDGAVASVSVDFKEIGRAAARAARNPRANSFIHADNPEVVVNPKAAAACGLVFPSEALVGVRWVEAP